MMRPSLLRALTALALVAAAAGCGGDGAPPPGMPGPGARLVAVSDTTASLRYGATFELRVRYEQNDGTPIPGAGIDFAFDGLEAGSTLSAARADTGDRGEAAVVLTAGSSDTTFRVVATPPLGDPLEFQIAVTMEDSGSIAVSLEYVGAGEPPFDEYRAVLFQDVVCDDLTPDSLPTALLSAAPVSRITDMPGFVPVAVGSGYAVAVQALAGGSVTGFGCSDGHDVSSGVETQVAVRISELGQVIVAEGVYLLDNRLDLGEGLPGGARTVIDVLDELTDDEDIDGNAATMDFGQDPGAFAVDYAMRQTCAWECMSGETFDTCSEINHGQGDISAIYLENFMSWDGAESRFFGGCGAWETAVIPAQNLVNDQVDDFVPDFVTAMSLIVGDIARAINQAHFTSRLTVDPPMDGQSLFIHELLDMIVVIRDLEGVEHTVMFDVLDAGLAGRPRDEAALTVVGDRVEIDMHGFDLDYGLLVKHIYLEVLLPLLGYASTTEMLDAWIDCDVVGASLASSVGILSEMQYADACQAGITAAGAYLDVSLDGFIPGDGMMYLQGAADVGTVGDDGVIQTLDSGVWTGGWGEGGVTGDIEGTFTGELM